jgi:hypothetical protein
MEDRETAKNVECRYRVTATIKADRTYELEVIKARLVGLGQISFASTPSPSSPKSLQTHQNITARRSRFAASITQPQICVRLFTDKLRWLGRATPDFDEARPAHRRIRDLPITADKLL